jgi:hypothetical protein
MRRASRRYIAPLRASVFAVTSARVFAVTAARVFAVTAALALAPSASAAQHPDPILVPGRRADVVVYSPAARDSVLDATRLRRMVSGCGVGMGISAADSAQFVDRPAPPFPLDVWQVRDAIVLVVIPTVERLVDCDDPRTQATLAPVRGLRVTLDTTYSPLHDVEQVIVRRGDRVLRPLVVERHPVRRLGAGGFLAAGDHWLRLAFDRTELAPDASGVITDLTVEVESPGRSAVERIALPWVAVRVAWESSLSARPVLGATVAGPVALPTPADARLGAMHAAYVAGEQERVLELAGPQFFLGTARSVARRDARTHAAMALLALGDTASARVVVATLVQEAPCVSIDAAAPAEVRAVFAGPQRPVARCTAQTTLRTATKAMFLPGFARPADGTRLESRLLVFLGSVGTTAAAVQQHVVARDRYDEYQAFQTVFVAPGEINNDVQRLFRSAERARHASVSLGTIGTLLWVGQGILAIRAERQHADALRGITHLGAARGVSLAPRFAPNSAGLSLSLTW